MTPTVARCLADTELFDAAHDALLGSDIHAAMALLRNTLRTLRSQLPWERWYAVGEHARRHRLHGLLLESPFTWRAFAKPRGYAGDAPLMDLIYRAPDHELSALGAMLYAYEFDSPCFQSVRRRRALLAREIDEVAARLSGARILAVACGHLRELEWSRAASARDVAITAVDQDRDSLAFLTQHYRQLHIRSVGASIRDLLRRTEPIGQFDLAYAAGLYDYLEDDVARALTTALFRMLAPGGRLLIANFTPLTADAAFMESIMDWHLIYRSAEAVRSLTCDLPSDAIDRIEQFDDENGHITYLRVIKR